MAKSALPFAIRHLPFAPTRCSMPDPTRYIAIAKLSPRAMSHCLRTAGLNAPISSSPLTGVG